MLDNKVRLICEQTISTGTVNRSLMSARDIFMKALEQGNEKLGQLIERNKSFIDNLNKKKNNISNDSKKDDDKK